VIALLARRFATAALLLWLVVTAVFFLAHAAPGDPSFLTESPRFSAADRAQLRKTLGLDRPLAEQYALWLGDALRGDWGVSLAQARPVANIVAEAIPPTLELASAAILIQMILGFSLGTAAALAHDRPLDHAIRAVMLVLFSIPVFWLGLMAILAFAVRWPILPAGGLSSIDSGDLSLLAQGADLARHVALPAAVIGVAQSGALARFVRTSLLDVLGQEWVRMARARGLPAWRVIWVHAARNALAPVLQVLALSVPILLSGALITEVVFSRPGLGRIAFVAVTGRDYPVVLATTAFSGALVILANLAADLLHAAVDPTADVLHAAAEPRPGDA